MHGVLLPLMRLRQQMAVSHAERLVLIIGKRSGMAPLLDGHLLHPAYRVESPRLEIGHH